MRTYLCLIEALQAIAVDATDAKHTAEAMGLRISMMYFDFIIAIFIMIKVLGFTHDLSQLLQRRYQDLGNDAAQVQYTMDSLDKLRLDESWTSIWDEAIKFVTELTCGIAVPGPETTMSTRTDIRNFLPGTRHIDGQTKAMDWFRINVFYVAIDKIRRGLKDRFNDANLNILKCLVYLQPKQLVGGDYDRGHFAKFAEEFWQPEANGRMKDQRKLDDLDRELDAFEHYVASAEFKSMKLVSLQDVLRMLLRDHRFPRLTSLVSGMLEP